MNKKYIPFLCVIALALIAWLFMPFMSYGSYSINVFEMLEEADSFSGLGPVSIIAAIIGGVVGIIAALLKKKTGAVIGAGLGTLGVIVCLFSLMDETGAELGDLFEFLGIGVWFALICFIVSLVLAIKIKNTQEA